jgi:hypothetical protein
MDKWLLPSAGVVQVVVSTLAVARMPETWQSQVSHVGWPACNEQHGMNGMEWIGMNGMSWMAQQGWHEQHGMNSTAWTARHEQHTMAWMAWHDRHGINHCSVTIIMADRHVCGKRQGHDGQW